jgi:hypothetical protein
MRKILFLFLSIIITVELHSSIDYTIDQKQGHVLEMAKSLPQVGILKKKSNGYIYLDISNEYISKTFPNMILDGHLRPTDSFDSEEGAHISVMKETENFSGIEEELGKEFTFTITDLRFVSSYKSDKYGNFSHHTGDRWMLGVHSPELEALRMRCGLSPLLDQHDFHISIGFEVPFDRINNFGERPSK